MNTKTKLMLGLSALTAGTLAAGATGTFAWFTTNKTATATYSKITAQAKNGNLQALITGLTETTVKSNEGNYAYSASASGTIAGTADVSSQDGIVFGQPNWQGEASNDGTTVIDGIKNVTAKSAGTGYFTQYKVSVKNVEAGNDGAATVGKVKVSLTGVVISGDAELAKWTRVAINIGATAISTDDRLNKGTTTVLYQNDITTTDYKNYVLGGDTSSKTMGEALKTVETTMALAQATLTDKVVVASELESNKDVEIGVSVWMEGTMANKQDEAKGKSVNVALTFEGETIVQ